MAKPAVFKRAVCALWQAGRWRFRMAALRNMLLLHAAHKKLAWLQAMRLFMILQHQTFL